MNLLVVGKNKSDIFHNLPNSFLFIADDIDVVPRPKRRKVTVLDLSRHAFNPLKDIDYRRAVEFVDVLKAAFPEGENTLTKATFEYQLLAALLDSPTKLGTLIEDTKETQYAYQKIQRLLLSPVLKSFLCRPTNFPLKGIVLVKLDKTVARLDRFVIANLLISNYKGHVVIPDLGRYACPFHLSLIEEDRLIAGVNFLDEVPKLRDALLLIKDKRAGSCTSEDAHTLAEYRGLIPGVGNHTTFIGESVA